MKTLKFRLKDKHSTILDRMARDVNFVWNYVNELSSRSIRERGKFLSRFDVQDYTVGATKEGLGLNSATVQMIGAEYVERRNQFKKRKLRWRGRKSLGWIPFRIRTVKYKDGRLKHNGHLFDFWESYDLSKYELGSGSFNQDSRGRWYVNIIVKPIKQQLQPLLGAKSIGIDLGLKDFLTTSDGVKVSAPQIYRKSQQKLTVAQRANKKSRVRSIHAKIKNQRLDFHHKLSTKLVAENVVIFVGDVGAAQLAKTKFAKSVLDAGWSSFRTMLRYKCDYAGVWFQEVNEKYTSQTCSYCGIISQHSPKGRAGLGIREWTCECGITHDRDINAAKNILVRGHAHLVGGILV